MVLAVSALMGAGVTLADDSTNKWSGENIITPVSAPDMVLEAVGSGRSEGTSVSIGSPADTPNQKWIFAYNGDGFYTIHPSHNSDMALTVRDGGTDNGSALILSADKGLDHQLWTIKTNSDGTLSIIPKHAPSKGIDDFGGGDTPGSKIDIWDYNERDEHLQWNITSSANGMPTHIPKGRVVEGSFENSRIFPGTVRRYWVYIPSQYNPSKPACVYVQQDGYGGFEARVFNQLIANHTMPVTIGVFVSPGNLPSPKGMDTPGRPNRSFEYDSVGDDYVRFITEELLPHIAETEHLNLSQSGNDRCIAGGSSGGICAFNAAWVRPDAFSRVYANSPSFVAFRGGNEYPTLVRKYEPKPIRVFMTCGTDDMENCAGDWTLLDLEMEKSLKFSGYEYEFHKIEGGHVVGWGPGQLTQAMTFLWKDWPNSVKVGAGAPRCQDVLLPNEPWHLLADGYDAISGAACNSRGEVFFADPSQNRIYRIKPGGRPEIFVQNAHHANSLSFAPNDELYAASKTTGNIMLYDAAGKSEVYATSIKADFITAAPNGGIYASVPDESGNENVIWFIKPNHKTKVAIAGKSSGGIAIRPDRWIVNAADSSSNRVYSFQANDDGTLTNKEPFFWLHAADWDNNAGTGDICYDKEGHFYAATRMGIQICSDSGAAQVIIPVSSGRVTSICFGGAKMDTLFAFCGGKIYARKVKTHGIGAFTPWTKMTPGQL